MATFKFEGAEDYDKAIVKLGDLYGPTCERMLNRAVKIMKDALKRANSVFAKYVRGKKAKHNKYGWFAQVHFGGHFINRGDATGTSAARAAVIYEYGRAAGSYVDSKGHTRPVHAQPARPWIRATAQSVEGEVVAAMQEEYDKAVAEIMG